MRIDKFLKISRIIKRRTVAKDVCEAGRVTLNGRPAKAGSEVKVSDILRLSYGNRQIEFEILLLADNIRADQASTMYRILSETKGPSLIDEL
ncbi:MAG: RNA-binding S4 domain-containing protein [Clostridiales bacterium]|jgi:ribosomal 50S subunit-recycling heat shock protein|nr:RNA-binding S4 domain-containing protein [Clostridiales bacterium]